MPALQRRRMFIKRIVLLIVLTLTLRVGAQQSQQPQPATQPSAIRAYIGAHVIPIAGPEIENGVLVVQGGKILIVGAVTDVTIPDGAERIDARGKIIMPGLV